MPDGTLRLLVGGILLLHGLGHGGAIAALAWIRRFGPGHTGSWTAARSWLIPSLPASTAELLACAAWALAMVGFVAAALSFWAIIPDSPWRAFAIVSAVVSIAGIVCFFGTWPMFNTLAAMAVNVGVLIALISLGWPSEALRSA
jgi:hypothetical protein